MYPTILIVDDEPSILQSLGGLLIDEGFEVIMASNGYEALKIIEVEFPDLILLDIWMPGMDGIETLQEIKKDHPYIQVIIITGHGTIETAVRATKLGAYDFIEKPLSIEKVIVAINNALNFRRLEEENKYLRRKTIEKHSIDGTSASINALKNQIKVAAPTDAWVLITGENGTGKELVARTIHQLSSRTDYPLIDVNCAAIPEERIDSELFGHEKGEFSGSVTKHRGTFELADSGTIFFDEIADMSLKTQAKLLRVLQEQKFQRVGGSRILKMNARVIAASNKDLQKEIENGSFREDLYFRLNVIPLKVPPLRERFEDIPVLVETFLAEYAKQNRSEKKTITSEGLQVLMAYSWPGNVRELKNLIERLVIMLQKNVIDAPDIPAPFNSDGVKVSESIEGRFFSLPSLKAAKMAFENEYIIRKLRLFSYHIEKTADAIGVDSSHLNGRLKNLKLTDS